MNFPKNQLYLGVGIILAVSAIISGILFYILYKDGVTIGSPVNMTITGQIGDYIGGTIGTIFAGAGFWLLLVTLRQQIKTNNLNEFDSQFSKMLLISQQNVNGMEIDASRLLPNSDKLYISPRKYSGKDVFQLFYYQFVTCRNELVPILSKSKKIYEKEYESEIRNSLLIKKREINIYELAKIDICFSIVFFGTNSEGLDILRRLFHGRYKENVINKILKFISLKPAFDKQINQRWLKFDTYTSPRNLIEHIEDIYQWRDHQTIPNYAPKFLDSIGYRSNFVKYYTGFHHLVGHYFRQLYQLICSVDGSKLLDENSKYNKIKLVRAQMSNYEQIVFFLNSLSYFGRVWEFDSLNKSNINLITKYKLIKNIPNQRLFGIDVKHYYPNINFEFFD